MTETETMTKPPADAASIKNEVAGIIQHVGRSKRHCIPLLQAVQNRFQYLPPEALEVICELTEITPDEITGVSTFYTQFRHKPVGDHIIHICHGTACHVKGAERVFDSLMRHLKIPQGEDTDKDGRFTLQKVACLGCCTLAPVVQIDDITYGHVQPDTVPKIIEDFINREADSSAHKGPIKAADGQPCQGEIRIGLGSCCVAGGSGEVQQAIEESLTDAQANVNLKRVGCVGMCHRTPLVEVALPDQEPKLYAKVQPDQARNIVREHFKPAGQLLKWKNQIRQFLEDKVQQKTGGEIQRYAIHKRDPAVSSFLGKQIHIATEHSGIIDPLDLEDYRNKEGFTALQKCLDELNPEQIIEKIQSSGLRGRGGGGFLTGLKWRLVRNADGESKYLICNGDEGDPGAFMDRMLLESYPFRIIEGMTIAAFAAGISEGIFYIRAEYPLAVLRIREALNLCYQNGLLGENILNSGFSLYLRIMEGAGAFVCGEETALIASIEGRRGMPRMRPPFPAEKGLWDKPTLVNNAETYSLVPWIIRNGASAFSNLGTKKSKGTKVFALAGKIARGGLIEVPMGITLRQIVDEIGGGIESGKPFKAVQVGGPSGGCIPAELAYIPVDYEALTGAGAMMGSGGLLVMDEDDCMVDIARYFMSFIQDQSCGKCTFCRVGTRRMLDILNRLCEGKAQKDDLEKLETLAQSVLTGSLCGLGKTAPNPVLTTLKYFREEYEAHLEGRCPAGKCKALIDYVVADHCIGCTLCSQHCPVEAIAFTPYEKHHIDTERCIRCGTCKQVCPEDAVLIESKGR